MASINVRKAKKELMRETIDKILKTGKWKRKSIDRKIYNKPKLEKFFQYTTNHMAFKKTLTGEDKYRISIEQDEFLMEVIKFVREKKMKLGPPKKIDIQILKDEMASYVEGDWESEQVVPSIVAFLMDYSDQQISESRFYDLIDNNPDDVELSELKEQMKSVRKMALDRGGATGRMDGRYVSQAMEQKDVSNRWNEKDGGKLDGKQGLAGWLADALK